MFLLLELQLFLFAVLQFADSHKSQQFSQSFAFKCKINGFNSHLMHNSCSISAYTLNFPTDVLQWIANFNKLFAPMQLLNGFCDWSKWLHGFPLKAQFNLMNSRVNNSWAWILIGHLWTFKWLRRSNGEELKICIAVRTKIKSFHWFSLVIVSLRLGFSLSLILSLEINSYVYWLLWIFSRFLLKQFQIQWS